MAPHDFSDFVSFKFLFGLKWSADSLGYLESPCACGDCWLQGKLLCPLCPELLAVTLQDCLDEYHEAASQTRELRPGQDPNRHGVLGREQGFTLESWLSPFLAL